MFDLYDSLLKPRTNKQKQTLENNFTELEYLTNIQLMNNGMFENPLSQDIDTHCFETILSRWGCLGAMKKDDKIVYGVLNQIGKPNEYGVTEKATISFYNGVSKEVTLYDDCVPCWNNSLHVPDYAFTRYAKMLTEVDKSINASIINARPTKVVGVRNSKVKRAIESLFSKIRNGESQIIELGELFNSEIMGEPTTMIDFTDISIADKIQYLSKLHDDLVRRLATLYGHPLQSTGKMAQVSTEEIQGYQTLSQILPLDKLNERNKFIKTLNETFGTPYKDFDFSEPWKVSNATMFVDLNENNEDDRTENNNVSRETSDEKGDNADDNDE